MKLPSFTTLRKNSSWDVNRICQELDGTGADAKCLSHWLWVELKQWPGGESTFCSQPSASMKMDSSASWAVPMHQRDNISKKYSTVDLSKPFQVARGLPSLCHCKPKDSNYISKVNSSPVFHLHAALIERSQDASFIQGRVSKTEKQNENQVNQLNS